MKKCFILKAITTVFLGLLLLFLGGVSFASMRLNPSGPSTPNLSSNVLTKLNLAASGGAGGGIVVSHSAHKVTQLASIRVR